MKSLWFGSILFLTALCGAPVMAQDIPELPAGKYVLDKSHASLIFRVDHLGMSNFTARFSRFDATLTLDPKAPDKAELLAEIDGTSIDFDNSPGDFLDKLRGPDWLNAVTFPKLIYKSSKIEMINPTTARITGELSLRGLTKPVVIEAKFNNGYAGHPMDPNARIGFSGKGVLKRSDFGIAFGIPAPGSKMGVSDAVEFILEVEFTGPAWAAKAP